MLNIEVKRAAAGAKIPTRGSADAAGWDLYTTHGGIIEPGETVPFHTGLEMAIPHGWCGMIYARSGLGIKKGLAPANKVGVIDADYRGEIIVALHNHGTEPHYIHAGDRIAQMIFAPVPEVEWLEVVSLSDTERGEGGFGSSGTN